MLEASVSTTNGMEKFGRCSTGVVVNICFNCKKASWASVDYVNFVNLSKYVSGEARVVYPRINLR